MMKNFEGSLKNLIFMGRGFTKKLYSGNFLKKGVLDSWANKRG